MPIFRITVVRVRLGRQFPGIATVRLERWRRTSLLAESLRAMAAASREQPIQHHLVYGINWALTRLHTTCISPLRAPAAQLTTGQLHSLFRHIDADLRRQKATPSNVMRGSHALRLALSHSTSHLADGHIVGMATRLYRTKKTSRTQLRKNEIPDSIGRLPHYNWDDLRAQAYSELNERLSGIARGIATEIDEYERVVILQQSLIARDVPRDYVRRVNQWNMKGRPPHLWPGLTDNIDDFLSVLLSSKKLRYQRLDELGWPGGGYPIASPFSDLPAFQRYLHRTRSSPWFHAHERLPNPVITSLFLALLCHTGWNPSSLCTLTLDGIIRQSDSSFVIQAYKRKTDDNTPLSEVNRAHKLAFKSLELLLWNRAQLEKLGLISVADRRLWLGWCADGYKNIFDATSSARLHAFSKRHGLERFSAQKIRPLKAALTYLPRRDIEAVRVLLGHQSLITTDGYLADSILFRLNEANMLEFQRRLETSITFSDGGERQVLARGLNPLDVDPQLIATGDGGYCADTNSRHPDYTADRSGPCPGVHCHAGAGCPNYKMSVDATSIEAALRTLEYYRSHWSDIFEQNPDGFRQFHIPRLMYIRALTDVVATKRPDLLARAKSLAC